ncbi:hypothetical protein K440DRAFT_636916 [Wilcoxina mikolae CBS 423.85]|nr:hypothetical protein K440DRAFT_636916 [Wilcoxina mikolae CBS 423.85]
MSTAVSTPILKLTEYNYRTWVIEAKDLLKHFNVWRIVDISEIVPVPPAAPAASGSSSSMMAPDPLDPEYDFKPESQDLAYLNRFDNFLQDWRSYKNNYEKANCTICSLLEPSIRSRYTAEKYDDLKGEDGRRMEKVLYPLKPAEYRGMEELLIDIGTCR